MEAVLSNSFGIGYERTKKEVYEELNSRIDTVILNSIKGYLRERKIDFDGRSIDLKEFKNKVVPKLDKQTQMDVANIEQGLNEKLKGVSEGLKDGSTTAFKKFADGVGSFTKSTVEMAARLTAVKAATALSPSLGGIALGASIMAPKVVKTVKDINKDVKENTTAALDVMLLKLGTSKNEDEVKYDVPEETRKNIAVNLKSEGVEVSTADSLHFLQDISELDNKQKELAVNMLNNAKGNPFDVKKEVEKTKLNLKKIKKIIGDDVVAPLSTAALFGMSAGTTLMETAPDLAPSVVTALSAGALTGNLAIGAVSGGGQYAISKFGHYIPVVGDIIEDYTKQVGAKETLLATTGTAAVATLALKVIPTLAYKGAKGVYGKIKNKKEAKDKKRELEDEAAVAQIQEKIEAAKNDADNELASRKSSDILIDVIRDSLKGEGVTIPKEVKTKEEFHMYVSRLSNEDKKKVYKVADMLEDITENNTKTLKTSLMKVGKAAYWGGVIALAGLGAYDAFLNPGFIEGLAERDKIKKELVNEPQNGATQSAQAGINGAKKSNEISQNMMYQKAQQDRQQQLAEAQKELDESVTDFREMLPENKEDYTNLMQEQPSFWKKLFKINKNAERNYENNKAVEYLGLNREEGLNSFLHSVQEDDPNNENLKLLMEQLHANSVDELSSNSILQESLDLVGGGNWYNYEYNDNLGHLTDGAVVGSVPASREIGNTLIKIINSQYAKNAGEIPLKGASNEEIISYIESLAGDQNKLNTLATYNGIKNSNPGILDYITEKLDDYQNYSGTVTKLVKEINEYSNAGNNIDEIQTGLEGANQAIQKYNDAKDVIEETQKKSVGYMTGVKSEISANPWVIGGAGAAAGASLGMATESKNIFKRTKEFISRKLFGRNKNKSLPSGEQTKDQKKEDKLEEKRKKLNINLDTEPLQINNIENVSKEKEKNVKNDDYEQEV